MTLAELLAKATPGPWRWFGNRKLGMYLGTPRGGRRFVMDFVRQGMRGAQPRFQVYADRQGEMWEWDGLMTPASDLAVLEVPYREDITDIDNADARLIALAPDLARLALDMGEALAAIRETRYLDAHDELCSDPEEPEYCDACALLARLDEIANKDKTT